MKYRKLYIATAIINCLWHLTKIEITLVSLHPDPCSVH